MERGRRIFFSKNCDDAAKAVGGYERIDDSLIPIFDALERNPYGFPVVESDWFSARVIVTKPFLNTPSLVWTFYIEPNGDVVLDHVEEYEGY
jgi:hypothetical protein